MTIRIFLRSVAAVLTDTRAKETRATILASEARVEIEEAVATGAATEAEVLMIVPSDHILTDQSPEMPGWMRAARK